MRRTEEVVFKQKKEGYTARGAASGLSSTWKGRKAHAVIASSRDCIPFGHEVRWVIPPNE